MNRRDEQHGDYKLYWWSRMSNLILNDWVLLDELQNMFSAAHPDSLDPGKGAATRHA